MGGVDSGKTTAEGQIFKREKQVHSIGEFSPKGVVAAVRIGICHRLNNAIFPMTFLYFVESEEAQSLSKALDVIKGSNEIKEDDLEEITGSSAAGDSESLAEVAKKSCGFYIGTYAKRMCKNGFKGTTDKEVIDCWREYVNRRLDDVAATTGDIDKIRQGWKKTLRIIDDIVGVASGAELPPIYGYGDENFFVDFGRMGPT